ncbi:hypothetical protein [Oceanicaulis sp. UBA2681]|mgnify:FL=1|uniref:hypothetical protein n=1 Tax=Oceanicaulis sp. UBA2681 TaxID=1947007 RepID=UPI00258044E5|nr:hypothetical protein [Oceanicaulis sp. UBA2681]|tara:strand:- start:2880 stop:3356 length:477 start_codon:yes stop_codon:yes gene_type:complete
MLATQMVATYNAAMECYRRAMAEGQAFAGREVSLKHAQRLSKAYLDQLAALDKRRECSQLKITMERVIVQAGGHQTVGYQPAETVKPIESGDADRQELAPAKSEKAHAPVEARLMAESHKLNTGPMIASPRCGAKTRAAAPCRSPAVAGKARGRVRVR